MALKDTWKPRIDGVDNADSSAVNEIAEAVIQNENDIEQNKQDISGKAPKATSLSGYGITDAYTKTEVDETIGGMKTALDHDLAIIKDKVDTISSKADAIVSTSSGDAIRLTDSADAFIRGLHVYGKTIQDGTPTPDAPIALDSVGEKGTVGVVINEQSFRVSTPDGLCGIPVTSGGTYTDSNCKQWVCDEVDFEQGVYIQRVGRTTLDSNRNWTMQSVNDYGIVNFQLLGNLPDIKPSYANAVMCNYLKTQKTAIAQTLDEGIFQTNNVIYVRLHQNRCPDVDALKSILAETPFVVYYVLDTPIQTSLTEEQISAYQTLQTYKPITNITNDENAGMKVDYAADTKNYIDNKFAQLQQAILSTGGNV